MKPHSICLILLALIVSGSGFAVTRLFYNGQIQTKDVRGAEVNWLAVKDGIVVGYGVESYYDSFADAEKIDLQGATVTPRRTLALKSRADFTVRYPGRIVQYRRGILVTPGNARLAAEKSK